MIHIDDSKIDLQIELIKSDYYALERALIKMQGRDSRYLISPRNANFFNEVVSIAERLLREAHQGAILQEYTD